MTSEERVLRAVRHQEGDRPPFYVISFYGDESKDHIKAQLGVTTMREVYDELGIDSRDIGLNFPQVWGVDPNLKLSAKESVSSQKIMLQQFSIWLWGGIIEGGESID